MNGLSETVETETAESPPTLPELEEGAAEAGLPLPPPVNSETEPPTPLPATTPQRALMLWVAATVILFDQLTKYLVEHLLPLGQTWEPIPGWGDWVRIIHTSNTGAAFGLFQGASPIFAVVAIFVSLALLYYNFTLPSGYRLVRLVLGFQLGGALGNLIDRFRIGHVTDFIDVGPWYIFNVADAAIVFGALALAWIMWREQTHPHDSETNHTSINQQQWEPN